ncbi:MAG: hypothetical protein FWC23_07110 [Chitinispirillia bacterium]|nr:hypothetical protein [Chitinispirillia bacterium]MCL2268937.1 hypothetical protein [Chitinispirillia bacterium]
MRILKITFLCIIALLFCGCTTSIIKLYSIKNQKYPIWMLNYEWGRNYLGLQYDEHNKERYEYDQNIFFIENGGLYGSRNSYMRLLINPEIKFEYLNIIEISYVKDNEKIYLFKNRTIKNEGYRYKELPVIKYRNFPKYFKNMNAGENVIITIRQIYKFDKGPIITEDAPYRLACLEQEYHPLSWLVLFIPTR